MDIIIKILLLAGGLYSFVYVGLMGQGMTRGRLKRMSAMMGPTVTRIIYVIIGLALIVLSVMLFVSPELSVRWLD